MTLSRARRKPRDIQLSGRTMVTEVFESTSAQVFYDRSEPGLPEVGRLELSGGFLHISEHERKTS
jgi:hypothetical protein